MPVITILLGSLAWGIANRMWGADDGIPKLVAIVFLMIALLASFLPVYPFLFSGIAALIIAVGCYVGRLSDGVRGSFLDKALRGWKYCGIQVGLFFLTGNPLTLIPALFFWQGGLIRWGMHRMMPNEDFDAWSERADGTVRGLLNLSFLFLAVREGAVIDLWSWAGI